MKRFCRETPRYHHTFLAAVAGMVRAIFRTVPKARPYDPVNQSTEATLAMATATKKKKKSKISIKLQPLGDRVVVEREEAEQTTSGGIVLPDSAQDKPSRGVILAIGDGRLLDDGTRGAMQVKVGDQVLFTTYGPQEIQIGDEPVLLMSETDIMAVLG